MPRGTAFQIIARPGFDIPVVAWGLVKTSPACTGLCRITGEDERAGGARICRTPGDTVHAVDAGLAELAAVRVHRQPATEFDPAAGDETTGPRHARKPGSPGCTPRIRAKWS
jgi:hypothetical protein